MDQLDRESRSRGLTPPQSVVPLFVHGIRCVGPCDIDPGWPDRDAPDMVPGNPKPNGDRFSSASPSELPEVDDREILRQRQQELLPEALLGFTRCAGPYDIGNPALEGSHL